MKTFQIILFSLGALLFASCEKEMDKSLTDVSVSVATNDQVRYEGNIVTVRKGTPVQFLLNGEPDFVSFFSGELGNEYIYSNRKDYPLEDVVSSELKFTVTARNGNTNSCKDMIDVLFQYEDPSDASAVNFPGMSKANFETDSVLVEQTTQWKNFATRDELPTALATPKTISKSVKDYIGKNMTLAIVYNKDQHKAEEYPEYSTGGLIAQSTYTFESMRVETTLKNGRVITLYASSFGFTPLNMKNKTVFKDQTADNMPKNKEYGSVKTGVSGMWNLMSIANGGFSIDGASSNSKWKYNWLVSDYLNLTACPIPDSGVKVKDISQSISTYAHTYANVGTYKATFLMNNANYADASSKICELIINVTE